MKNNTYRTISIFKTALVCMLLSFAMAINAETGTLRAALHATAPINTPISEKQVTSNNKGQSGGGCNASFTIDSVNTKSNTAYFTDNSTGGLVHMWYYGDGDSSSNGTLYHVYAKPGVYYVCLYVIDSVTHCTNSYCQSVIDTIPYTGCRAGYTYIVAGDTVKFTNTSTSPSGTLSYYWTFGDSSSSIDANPTHIYRKYNSFNACLTISGSNCNDTYCNTISVIQPACHAAFTIDSVNMNSNTVVFTDNSAGGVSHMWYYGDGDSSSGNTTYHIYAKPGVYQVCLYIFDTATHCSDYHCAYVIDTLAAVGCHAFFAIDSVNTSSNTAFFTDKSTGGIVHMWYYGDGDSSSNGTTYHVYAKPGVYQVCLYVLDSITHCSSYNCQYVIDTVALPCNADYTYTDTGYTVTFNNISTSPSGSLTYYWTFGDSTISTDKNPVHTYSKYGTYNVCLVISGTNCYTGHCYMINVAPSACNASFTVDSTDTITHVVYVTNHSTGASSQTWVFGDGDTSSASALTHNYAIGGTYNLCLYIICAGGVTSSHCALINGDSSRVRSANPFSVVIVNANTGTTNVVKNNTLTIYPNPVSNILLVNIPLGITQGMLTVKNTLGQQIIQQDATNKTTLRLDMSTLAAGIYIIQLNSKQGQYTTKVVKN